MRKPITLFGLFMRISLISIIMVSSLAQAQITSVQMGVNGMI